MSRIKKLKNYFVGITCGILNGLFGTGGGLVIVPLLQGNEIPAKKSHATSIAIILPLSIISAAIYAYKGVQIDVKLTLILIGAGIIGAFIGAKLLKVMPDIVLKKTFSVVMIISAIRLLLK
ncbi:MAG: sulfite exporter TauE/SafE family protein [Oscillospiraceae bacterium]